MIMIQKILNIFTVLLTIRSTDGVRFVRTVEAVGYPYYKILFSLGTCKDRLLYKDNKIWGSVRLNRVFDIYFETNDGTMISTVEIILVVNNTDCVSNSYTGVGGSKFSAILVLPTNIGILFYSLNIFSCSVKNEKKQVEETASGFIESSEYEYDE